ncbi:metallophosphoesterase family protein [Methylobacterium frigidaeris]|uniref:Bis(5'-nucleosyl)-tetraphosphatase, symmetrical n=1 Tax=Methylobacterium frigidaeris TaxID=2038277 RepID=A0AA37HIB0_9HYPH|nr:metallophosphoesterase family protein [Methylobacterium frigidaeris]PIK70872.1 serine/threonine protein phosphatase [Methylobacterium frigidaeris]GJD66283.1 Bis(5'-nucleosyl)-tetraphosphatase, symmetrical [Methylobacterium frigidaeris]
MSRTYAIADLHGRYDLLCAALDAIKRHGGGKIVTLGDYVDRGAESAAIVHLLRLMQQKDPDQVVCLAGNHEDMMVRAGKDWESFWRWVMNGGRETLASYGINHIDDVPAEDRAWLAALPTLHQDAHRIYVHAGLRPDKPIEPERRKDRLWIRDAFLELEHDFGKHVVHGHTPVQDGPDRRRFRTNLDTRAWRSGRLVIGVFDDGIAGGPVDLIEVVGTTALELGLGSEPAA